ncbi:MAG: ribosome maturation factor RimM [Clostridia bacterium]|nr:ribosome maturation factor RimM [Clostridia bacterium]MDD4375400.1 ribosome maturation factor RimM [Clostridia bacterium]
MEYIEFGKIVNTHGIKGDVKIYPYTNDFDQILKQNKIYIDETEYTIQKIQIHKNMLLVKIKGIDTCNEAEMLKDKMVKRLVNKTEELSEDEYFVKDLIGLDVYDKDSKQKIGKLEDVLQTGANDIYVIKTETGKEILLPAIESVVKDISLNENKMFVELIEGLL